MSVGLPPPRPHLGGPPSNSATSFMDDSVVVLDGLAQGPLTTRSIVFTVAFKVSSSVKD